MIDMHHLYVVTWSTYLCRLPDTTPNSSKRSYTILFILCLAHLCKILEKEENIQNLNNQIFVSDETVRENVLGIKFP